MQYTYNDTDRKFYERAYDILAEHAGAPKNANDKETFALSFLPCERRTNEYRICHALGFGGKF